MIKQRKILLTGGAGFIGSHTVDHALSHGHSVVVLDSLTYAGNLDNLSAAERKPRFSFVQGDICDHHLVGRIMREHEVDTVLHLAAESHVDNSIASAAPFIATNIVGTYCLLEEARKFCDEFSCFDDFRFLHVSTDEVFGELADDDPPFHEAARYSPNSPYSASKAASDHLVRAWHRTYGLPVILVNCSNNFGPRQHREKLIPTLVRTAQDGGAIPIYGTGRNIRDWLYVADCAAGLLNAVEHGAPGETYCLGGRAELTNLEMAGRICDILDTEKPRPDGRSYREQIRFVADRAGHDWRYALDTSKAELEIRFSRKVSFDEALRETVLWFSSQAVAGKVEDGVS